MTFKEIKVFTTDETPKSFSELEKEVRTHVTSNPPLGISKLALITGLVMDGYHLGMWFRNEGKVGWSSVIKGNYEHSVNVIPRAHDFTDEERKLVSDIALFSYHKGNQSRSGSESTDLLAILS